MKFIKNREIKNSIDILNNFVPGIDMFGRPLVIAVDFDGTIITGNSWKLDSLDDYKLIYIDIDGISIPTIDIVIEYIRKGHIVIVWTCRENKFDDSIHGLSLNSAIEWCSRNRLYPYGYNCDADWINIVGRENVPTGRKIVADRYIDDRATDINSSDAWNIVKWNNIH